MGFTVVPRKDVSLYHHLKVGPFTTNLCFSSYLRRFMGTDDELVRPRELVDIFEIQIMNFACILFQV